MKGKSQRFSLVFLQFLFMIRERERERERAVFLQFLFMVRERERLSGLRQGAIFLQFLFMILWYNENNIYYLLYILKGKDRVF